MEKPFKLTLRVVWWVQIFQIIFALPFTIGGVLFLISIFRGANPSWPAFYLCVFLAYLGWANAFSTIEVTEESVTVSVFYGRFRIDWSEVERIVMNDFLIALQGNDKRIVLSLAMVERKSGQMLEYFGEQIERRGITFEQNVRPFPLTHRNARVWW